MSEYEVLIEGPDRELWPMPTRDSLLPPIKFPSEEFWARLIASMHQPDDTSVNGAVTADPWDDDGEPWDSDAPYPSGDEPDDDE